VTSDNLVELSDKKYGRRLTATFKVVPQDPSAGTEEKSVGCRQYSWCADRDQKQVLQMIWARSTNEGEESISLSLVIIPLVLIFLIFRSILHNTFL
jgi:hypothetical protein